MVISVLKQTILLVFTSLSCFWITQSHLRTNNLPERKTQLVLTIQLKHDPLGNFLLPRTQFTLFLLPFKITISQVCKIHAQQALPCITFPTNNKYLLMVATMWWPSTYSTLRFGMWQNWWNTFGHLSQQTNSPPSMHTAHQSSFGSSLPGSVVFSLPVF